MCFGKTGIIKIPISGDQTMQMYGNFHGFPGITVHCLDWCHIMTSGKLYYQADFLSGKSGRWLMSPPCQPFSTTREAKQRDLKVSWVK